MIYASWIEIPVADFDRALLFYRAVFELENTPIYNEPTMRIAVLSPSNKSEQQPGISLVQSPLHHAGQGIVVNFHVGNYTAFDHALVQVRALGGQIVDTVTHMDDGVRYVNLRDCEGNSIALSAYEAL